MPTDEVRDELLREALAFVATDEALLPAFLFAVHRHGRQRRDDGSTFIVHPLRVLGRLLRLEESVSSDVRLAAVLHDTIEDTEATWNDLDSRFGERVANVVAELTQDERLPRKERKDRAIEKAPDMSRAARLVKLADRIDNVGDMCNWSDAKKRRYLGETRRWLDGLRGTEPTLEEALENLLKQREREQSQRGDSPSTEYRAPSG